jgi:hypothetical protein
VAYCTSCGADIFFGEVKGSGERIPLERHAEAGPGDDRYIIESHGSPPLLVPVSPTSTAEAYADHRKDCPDHGNGLT